MGSGSLVAYDKLITAPTVVIHGQRGQADAAVRGPRRRHRPSRRARLVLFDGMGHDLPERVVGRHRRRTEDPKCPYAA